jgi:hypothetical protein
VDNVSFHDIRPRDLSPIAPSSVDAVVSMAVFIHLNLYDIHGYFLAFRDALKPGGRVVFDFTDADRLFSRWRRHGNDDLFREHATYYRSDPSVLAELVQFNSARGIVGVARDAGFERVSRQGHKLLFRKR